MNLSSGTPRLELLLHSRQVLNVENRAPRVAIECKNGVIWVTCTGEHEDYILRAGSSYIPKIKGNIVIEAIDEARVDIAESQ